MIMTTVLLLGAIAAAVQAVRSRQLISVALWLAGVSAFVSLLMFQMGAHAVAVIELSVGAGLVTILFVFAMSITGTANLRRPSVVPRMVAGSVMVLLLALLLWLMAPAAQTAVADPAAQLPFSVMLWQERGLDVVLQIGLIFGAVMCILGLLTDVRETTLAETAVAQQAELDEPEPNRVTVPR